MISPYSDSGPSVEVFYIIPISGVGIVIGYGVRFLTGPRDTCVSLSSVQTDSGTHPPSIPVSAGGSFRDGKAAKA